MVHNFRTRRRPKTSQEKYDGIAGSRTKMKTNGNHSVNKSNKRTYIPPFLPLQAHCNFAKTMLRN